MERRFPDANPYRKRNLVSADPASHPELSPLSMTEFESLRRGLRDLRQLSNGLDPARLRSYGEQVAAITDHFMSAYLQGIDKFAR
jgi:hypothetical protein